MKLYGRDMKYLAEYHKNELAKALEQQAIYVRESPVDEWAKNPGQGPPDWYDCRMGEISCHEEMVLKYLLAQARMDHFRAEIEVPHMS